MMNRAALLFWATLALFLTLTACNSSDDSDDDRVNGEKTVSQISEEDWDHWENCQAWWIDTDGNGTLDEACDIHYYYSDDRGLRLDNCSVEGIAGHATYYYYWYDHQGLPVRIEERNYPGMSIFCIEYNYDESGNRISKNVDRDCDGLEDEIADWVYDERGNLLHYGFSIIIIPEYGAGVGGNYDYQYDEHDRLIFIRDGSDCDGECPLCTHYDYDDDGNQILIQIDESCDDLPEECTVSQYNEQGHMIESHLEYHCDGNPNRACSNAMYDENQNRLTRYEDMNCDGTTDSCTSYTYDDRGNPVSVAEDQDCDGTPESCTGYTYDDRGNPVSVAEDQDCDGTPESCESYMYDVNNQQILIQIDEGCDGRFEVNKQFLDRCESR